MLQNRDSGSKADLNEAAGAADACGVGVIAAAGTRSSVGHIERRSL